MKNRIAVVALLLLAGCHREQPANVAAPAKTIPNLADARRVPAPDSGAGSAALPAPELEGVATATGRWRSESSRLSTDQLSKSTAE